MGDLALTLDPDGSTSGQLQRRATTTQAFLAKTFAWMFVGLALTAGTAAVLAAQTDVVSFFEQHVWVLVALILVEFGLVLGLTAAIEKIGAGLARFLFCSYAAINGIVFSLIFSAYTAAEIAPAFLVTAGVFAAMAAFGYLTKIDLGPLGTFLFMALIGLLLAMVLNLFFASSALYWLTTGAGILIFSGLTAYDLQRLKEQAGDLGEDQVEQQAIFGALSLYLDFVNLFLFILRLFGGTSD